MSKSGKRMNFVSNAADKVDEVIDGIQDKMDEVVDDIQDKVGEVAESIQDKIEDVKDKVVEEVQETIEDFTEKVDAVVDAVQDKMDDVAEDIQDKVEEVKKVISDFLVGKTVKLLSAFRGFGNDTAHKNKTVTFNVGDELVIKSIRNDLILVESPITKIECWIPKILME